MIYFAFHLLKTVSATSKSLERVSSGTNASLLPSYGSQELPIPTLPPSTPAKKRVARTPSETPSSSKSTPKKKNKTLTQLVSLGEGKPKSKLSHL